MQTHFLEAVDGSKFNWGKFILCRWDKREWEYRSTVTPERSLLRVHQWTPDNLLVVDLATGEGAVFRPGGLVSADLDKHKIWVCPMFQPMLEWLYKQDLTDLDKLPGLIDLGDVPTAMHGYRRHGTKTKTATKKKAA